MSTKLWESMTEAEQLQAIRLMRVYGGSFAGHIADAWLVADSHNTLRLAAAFPDLLEKFHPKNWSHHA